MMKKRLFTLFLLSVFMGVALQAGNYRKDRRCSAAHSYKAFGF